MENPARPRNRVDHLANERTFLAWIRTSIGVMAFGFVIEKFAVFVKQIALFLEKQKGLENTSVSAFQQESPSIFGVFLIVIGALIGLFAYIKYKKTEKQIDEDTYQSSRTLASVLTLLIIVLGIFLIVYLINT